MPSALSITAVIFGIVPLWSLIFMHRPWEIFDHVAGWKGAVLIFNFWIGPFAISLCAFTRHKFLIPLFLVECGTMLLYSMVDITGNAAQVAGLQGVLIAAMFFFAFFLLRTDALHPLMRGAARPWRASPRIHVGLQVRLSSHGQKGDAKAILQNCSLTGMEISGRSDELKPFVGGKRKEDQLDFTLTFDDRSWDFTSDIAWSYSEDGEQRLGLHIANKPAMEQFFLALPLPKTEAPLVQAVIRQWENKPLRQAVISLWAIIILAAFVIPTAKRHFVFTSASANQATPTTISAGLGPVYRPK